MDLPTELRTTEGLRWFGQAIRGSWGDIDGRSIQGGMDTYADYIDANPPHMPASSVTIAAHQAFGICLTVNEDGDGWFAIWSDMLWRDEECVVCGAVGQ